MEIFDDRCCTLGEGPLWLPERATLIWADIPARRLLGRSADAMFGWEMPEMVSGAGRVDDDRLVLCGESGIWLFGLDDGAMDLLCPIPGVPGLRSNDTRVDPWGGVWTSTMSLRLEPEAGSIFRWYRGELRQVASGLTIPNAICFAPDRRRAYFADSRRATIYAMPLDTEGWPAGRAEVFFALPDHRVVPDGAVTDTEGCLWCALWGGGLVVRLAPDGTEIARFETGPPYPTCPAFGGAEFADLYVTTMTNAEPDAAPPSPLGRTLRLAGATAGVGRPEPRVRLDPRSTGDTDRIPTQK